jgi:hypothetical protein
MANEIDASHQERTAAFLAELTSAINSHNRVRRWDSGLYQFLVIGAAIAGFASLYAGTIGESAKWAGIIGALTSVATILGQQLHCVKAVNWHSRMSVELDALRLQLLYENQSTPSEATLAELSESLRKVKLKMTEEWERVTNSQPGKLGNIELQDKSGKKQPKGPGP